MCAVNEDPQTPSKLGLCVAEFFGTALLLFLGCMGCITEYEGMQVPHYMPAITFGLTVMLIIQIFGHISGSHLNPSVTLAAVLLGYMEVSMAPIYFVGQFTGAVFGFGLLKFLVPYEYTSTEVLDLVSNTTSRRLGLCSSIPHPKVGALQGLSIEIIITAILILTCCAIWDKRNSGNQDSTPLRFGFIIAVLGLVAGPFSGGSMNTARSFAPALLNNDWSQHWIYWLGPNIGALIAVYFYKSMYGIAKDSTPSNRKSDDGGIVELEKINSAD